MTTTVTVQHIISASASHLDLSDHNIPDNSVVTIMASGGEIKMFLPAGTGDDVAAAINAALEDGND